MTRNGKYTLRRLKFTNDNLLIQINIYSDFHVIINHNCGVVKVSVH